MKNFALIGHPLGHSMSPFIHRELMKISGVSGKYNLIDVEEGELKTKFRDLTKLDGFNVTIPYKVDIIDFLDELDDRARLFGAVNTVKVGEKNKGFNTDCSGFLRALDMAGIDLSGNVLLCGSGGVARMFAFESILAHCNLTIAVRDSDIPFANQIKAEINEKLGEDATVLHLSEVTDGYDLVINGTSLGMTPHVETCVLPKEIIVKSKSAFDAVYNPAETLFIKYAKEAGLKCSNGLPMLVWQAAVAQEIWLGTEFSFSEIENVIKLTEKELG